MTLFDVPPPEPVPEPSPAGRCRRCKRLITDPVSLGYQIGPDCRHRLGIGPAKKPPRFSVRWTGPVKDQIELLEEINEGEAMNPIGTTESETIREEAAALADLDGIAKTTAQREILHDLACALRDLHAPIKALFEDQFGDREDFTAELADALDALSSAAGGVMHAANNI